LKEIPAGINGNGRLDGKALAILQALASWRDQVAEKRNLAGGFAVKDVELLIITNEMLSVKRKYT